MAQRIVELVIGRLVTDQEFRARFLRDPRTCLMEVCDRGLELSPTEILALMNTDHAIWTLVAEAIDTRLQKVSLKNETGVS